MHLLLFILLIILMMKIKLKGGRDRDDLFCIDIEYYYKNKIIHPLIVYLHEIKILYNITNLLRFKNLWIEYIEYDRLTNIKYIAEGSFSKVYSATWINDRCKSESRKVALKVLNNSNNAKDFLNEVRKSINEFKFPCFFFVF